MGHSAITTHNLVFRVPPHAGVPTPSSRNVLTSTIVRPISFGYSIVLCPENLPRQPMLLSLTFSALLNGKTSRPRLYLRPLQRLVANCRHIRPTVDRSTQPSPLLRRWGHI